MPLPTVKEPDLALNDRELAIDLEDPKLPAEELHPGDLENDIACKCEELEFLDARSCAYVSP